MHVHVCVCVKVQLCGCECAVPIYVQAGNACVSVCVECVQDTGGEAPLCVYRHLCEHLGCGPWQPRV